MIYPKQRLGLLVYGLLSIVESIGNTLLYISHLDLFVKPFDWAFPFYFWYTNKFLKGVYITNLKRNENG